MAHKTLVNGTAYEVKGGRTLVDGTGYSIKGGRTLVEGTGYDISFCIPASSLAVGSSVYLMENAVATEYLVVHQGLPSTMYDESCSGMWLLRKDRYESIVWDSSCVNDYANSTINAYLNGDFFNLFGAIEQATIKQVKIPYRVGSSGSTINSGANGLTAKIFLLGGYEVGWTQSTNKYFPIDGACLSYFSGLSKTDSKRISYRNGSAGGWWLRSAEIVDSNRAWLVSFDGGFSINGCSVGYSARPSLILPSNALFDSNLLLKGVA